MKAGHLTVAIALSTLLASPAWAEPARDAAKAETLFKSGKELLAQEKWAEACPKFQASMELDPSVSTLLKIARCHEHDGKLALAWNDVFEARKLNSAVDQPSSRRRELEDYADKMLAELDKRVPKLHVRAASVPANLHISCDGLALPIATLGERLPVDVGEHEIVAEAPGFAPFRARVKLIEGQTLDVELILTAVAPPGKEPPSSGDAPPVPAPLKVAPSNDAFPRPLPPTGTPESAAPRSKASETVTPGDPGRTRRVAGISVASVGIASLGGALALGLLSRSRVSGAKPYCAADFSVCNDERGFDMLNQARGMEAGGFALLGVGAAALGTGIVLVVTAPRAKDVPSKTAVTAVVGPLGASLRGAW